MNNPSIPCTPSDPCSQPSASPNSGGAAIDERASKASDTPGARLAPLYTKEIVYDRETRDYAMYLDGELVGFARTYHEAEVTLDQLVFELLTDTGRTATELDGGLDDDGLPAAAVQPIEYPQLADDLAKLLGSNAIYARPAEPATEVYYCSCGQADEGNYAAERVAQREPCRMNVLGTHWTICGAPSDEPCMCGVAVRTIEPPAALPPACPTCADPVDRPGLCEACQEAGEPWPQDIPALIGALLDAWKESGVETPYDEELAALARRYEQLRAPQPVCRICRGPHQAATCPKVKAERLRQAEASAARQYDGGALYEELCNDPRRFFAAFDGWCARTQASATRAIAAFWGCDTMAVDADLVERRQRLMAEVA